MITTLLIKLNNKLRIFLDFHMIFLIFFKTDLIFHNKLQKNYQFLKMAKIAYQKCFNMDKFRRLFLLFTI